MLSKRGGIVISDVVKIFLVVVSLGLLVSKVIIYVV